MDRIYRVQRHFYDLTRKFYLLGRDRLIRELDAAPGQTVCEIGCGTARNLVKLARRYPGCRYFGIDASAEMLETAEASLRRAGLEDRVRLGLAFAEKFDPEGTFDEGDGFDHIVFSYSLSMIPPWDAALERAVQLLRPGGTLHIVDFGDQRGMPAWFRRLLFTWLSWFHVEHRPGIRKWVEARSASPGIDVRTHALAGNYAELFRLRRTGQV
ncbi:class I SAM-dependent methyltransferase [Nisaea acidiphila]|uniref:Class I SAM-dependent methyltransferase n=1 Tax=Nisaea acidiphila TaxID=1862145 RepID=A0A9J7AQT2_9PROT|nr:class I SAM-dependent methyltransferase [Nisaea acidiphila]UUX49534.1 class I SAM-dependent methyltransferase [Nisaea acidiphila]